MIGDDKLAQLAWNILSNRFGILNLCFKIIYFFFSYCSTVCIQHQPNEIATACIYLAAKISHLEIPDGETKKWWMVFEVSWNNVEGSLHLSLVALFH